MERAFILRFTPQMHRAAMAASGHGPEHKPSLPRVWQEHHYLAMATLFQDLHKQESGVRSRIQAPKSCLLHQRPSQDPQEKVAWTKQSGAQRPALSSLTTPLPGSSCLCITLQSPARKFTQPMRKDRATHVILLTLQRRL